MVTLKNSKTLLRYLLVGGSSFVFEYSTFLLFVYVFSWPVWVGQAASYGLTIIVNFLLLRNWAFGHRKTKGLHREFYKYVVLIAINLPLTTMIIHMITAAGVRPFESKIIVVALAAIWNYFVYDKLIFKKRFSPEDVV